MIFEIALIILTLLLLRHWLNSPKGLPPGPYSIPFIGSGVVSSIDQAKKYQKKYGDIFRTEVANKTAIYICDYKLIKEALSKIAFADRPLLQSFNFMSDGIPAGVIFTNGQRWMNARRFLLRNLKDLGMGKSSLDTAIIHEAEFLVEDFKKFAGKPTTFPDSLNIAVLNVVWQMIASRRYDLYDKKVHEFITILKSLQDDILPVMLLDFFPGVKYILPQFVLDKLFGMESLRKTRDSAKKIFGEIFEHRKAEMDLSNPENIIDEYMIQMKEQTDTAQYFDEHDLMSISFDLFFAGYDTTSNMLRWMVLYAAKYPEVQGRVQKQIDAVVPKGEYPGHHHKAQLPLVEAYIHEVLRCTSLIPFGLMHSTPNEVQFANYRIPKGALVMGVTAFGHQDPRYWDDPQEFKIDRFLDDEEQFVSHREGFAPFGIGKRSCLGESLARMELSIFTTSLLQNFTFSPPEGKTTDLTPQNKPFFNVCKINEEFVMQVRQ